MRKKLIIFVLAIVSSIIASAQNTIYQQSVDKKYESAIELFQKNEYLAARSLFDEYLKLNQGADERNIEANYYKALASLYLNTSDAIDLLTDFAKQYNYHPKGSLAYFELGSYYLPKKEFPKVIEYFEKTDSNVLTKSQKLDYNFKLGYAYFNEKKFEKAGDYFEKIYQSEHQYTSAVNYYLGYVYYRLGEYDRCMPVLKKAEENESFKYLVPAMKANVYNKQQKYDTLIAYNERVLRDNPEIKSADELTLLLAEAYYKKLKYPQALGFFKKYIAKNDKELRSDINYRIGYSFYMCNENQSAVEYFKKINSLNDTIGQYASYFLGMAYIKLKNKPFAYAALEQAGLMPFDLKMQEEAFFSAAKIKFDLEKFSEAIVLLKTFTKTFPKSGHLSESAELISEAYLHSNNYSEAINYIEAQKEKTPRLNIAYQRVTYYKGLEYFNNDKFSEALVLLKKSAAINLDRDVTIACYFYAGEIYSANQKFDDAVESYAAIFRIPNAEKNSLYYKTRYGIGYAYYNQQKYDKALTHFREYVENQNSDINPEVYADALVRLADCYYVNKHYTDAFQVYEKALLSARADLDYITFQKGLTAFIAGRNEEGKQNFEAVITKYPNFPFFDDALYNRALIDFESGAYSTSIAWFDKLINLKPGSIYLPEALKKRAIANSNLKNFTLASDDYERILNEFPTYFENSTDILEGLSNALNAQGKEEKYTEILSKFKNANPNNTAYAELEYKNAENLFDKQKYPQAIKAFTDFANAYPTNSLLSDAYFFIGESFFRTNDKVEALKSYEKVIESGKGNYKNKAYTRAADLEFSLKSYREALIKYQTLLAFAVSKREQFNATKGIMECYFELNTLDSAFYFATNITQQGGAPVYIQNKANLYLGKIPYLKEKYEDAQDALINTANIAKDSSGAEAQYLLADILYKQKNYKLSLETLFQLNDKFKMYDRWVLKSFLLIADNYTALEEYFQSKTTLNSIIQKAKDPVFVKMASDKLDKVIEIETNQLKQGDKKE